MPRLHSERLRSYPGRPVQLAVDIFDSALSGNMQCDWTGVSRGHIRRRKSPCWGDGDWKRDRRIEKPGGSPRWRAKLIEESEILCALPRVEPDRGSDRQARCKNYHTFRYYLQLPPSCCQRAADILHPATVRCSLRTAWCGPACQVVWGLGEKIPRLPD